jgi:long-chain acyl-CoA synthetase
LIFSKWREALGGNVKVIVTGAAPCPVKIMRVFCAAGIPIREGYGLTETSPTLTINTMEADGAMLGTAGPLIKGVELLIDQEEGDYKDDEGEILAYGPNVMTGYYKKPEINAQVFCEINGKRWFRTGDIGKLVKGPTGREFLKITDRKKELLKTSGGKYVAPAPIENRLREEFLVEQMMVIGDRQKFVSALIVPAEEALKSYCEKKEIPWTSLNEIIKHKKVLKRYQKIVNKYNPEFSHVEQIKKFKLISSPWLPFHQDGTEAELTPTLKLKRRVIREKFKLEITEIYME